MKKFSTILLLFTLLFALLPMAVLAQEETPQLPSWALGLPSILTGLVLANLRLTDGFKRLLAGESLGYVPPKDIQGVLVLAFSIVVGIGSAWVVPHATDWLGEMNPIYAIIITGFSVSAVGGAVYEVLGRLSPSKSVYRTTTEISTPPSDTSQKTASETLAVASQAVDSGKG